MMIETNAGYWETVIDISKSFPEDEIARTNPIDRTFVLRDDCSQIVQLHSILHESIHIILDEIGKNDLSEQEAFVGSLTDSLFGYIIRNEHYIKMIWEEAYRIKNINKLQEADDEKNKSD